MYKIIISLVMALTFIGCAFSGTMVASSVATAVAIAENAGGLLDTYYDTKFYLMGDSNSTDGE